MRKTAAHHNSRPGTTFVSPGLGQTNRRPTFCHRVQSFPIAGINTPEFPKAICRGPGHFLGAKMTDSVTEPLFIQTPLISSARLSKIAGW